MWSKRYTAFSRPFGLKRIFYVIIACFQSFSCNNSSELCSHQQIVLTPFEIVWNPRQIYALVCLLSDPLFAVILWLRFAWIGF
jgi:hypothetical protein